MRPAEKATALAAVLEAARQEADEDTAQLLRRFFIAVPPSEEIERAFPERIALVDAVRRWPKARKRAALEWVRTNATWVTQLNALVQESYGSGFEPREWGPTMSQFDPGIFARRATLAPLLREALGDSAVVEVAATVARAREPFTQAGLAERRAKLVAYLRIPDELPRMGALFNTVLSPGNGVNAFLPDGTLLFVVGPTVDSADWSMILFHEMAHEPVNRVLDSAKAGAALTASACAFDAVTENSGYRTWRSYFAETLVRALSYRLQQVGPFDTGFLYEREVTELLRTWEATPDRAFEDAVVDILGRLRERHCT